jgi:hypothetical protein
MDKECLQQVKDFKYVGCEIFYEKRKDMQYKQKNLPSTVGILTIFKPVWIQKSLKK